MFSIKGERFTLSFKISVCLYDVSNLRKSLGEFPASLVLLERELKKVVWWLDSQAKIWEIWVQSSRRSPGRTWMLATLH